MGSESFADLMGRLGVSDNTTVVSYDDFNTTYATRLLWVLNYYGHTDAKVLNGGWDRWLAESRPISREETETLAEMWSGILAEVRTTPAPSEIGRLAQLLKAAGVTEPR